MAQTSRGATRVIAVDHGFTWWMGTGREPRWTIPFVGSMTARRQRARFRLCAPEHVRKARDTGFCDVSGAWGAASRDTDRFQHPDSRRGRAVRSSLLLMLRHLRQGQEQRAV